MNQRWRWGGARLARGMVVSLLGAWIPALVSNSIQAESPVASPAPTVEARLARVAVLSLSPREAAAVVRMAPGAAPRLVRVGETLPELPVKLVEVLPDRLVLELALDPADNPSPGRPSPGSPRPEALRARAWLDISGRLVVLDPRPPADVTRPEPLPQPKPALPAGSDAELRQIPSEPPSPPPPVPSPSDAA